MSEKDHVPFGLCPYCDRFVPDFQSHYFFQPGKFRTPCKECTLVISNPFCVKRHEKIVHNIDDDVEEVFKSETENDDPSILTCDVDIGDDDVCGIEFKKERNLNRHKKLCHHPDQSTKSCSVWIGKIDIPVVSWFEVTANEAFGKADFLNYDLPKKIAIDLRPDESKVRDAIEKVFESDAELPELQRAEVTLVSLLPKSKEERYAYMAAYNYLKTNDMYGVSKIPLGGMVRDFYLFPLSKTQIIHQSFADCIGGPGLDDDRDHLLLALIVRSKWISLDEQYFPSIYQTLIPPKIIDPRKRLLKLRMESKTRKEEKLRQLKEELAGLIEEEDRMKKEEKRKSLLLKRLNLKKETLEKISQMEEEFANLIRQDKRKNLLTKWLNLKAKKLDAKQEMKEELAALEKCNKEITEHGVGTEFFNLFRLTV